MRNISRAFKEQEAEIYQKVIFNFFDGRTLTLDDPDLFKISGNAFSDSAGQSAFPLGVAISKTVTLSLWNDDDRYQSYDFNMAEIILYAYKNLEDGTTETILLGHFTVTTPESYGTTVEVTGIDDMYKMDVIYNPSHSFPVSLEMAVRELCSSCGVSLLTTTFKNGGFVVEQKPESITGRQFLGYAAQIACGNARFDEYNRLAIKAYDFSSFETTSDLYGGIFDGGMPYSSGDAADGGSFNPWNIGDECDSGTFDSMGSIHALSEFKNEPSKSTDDVVITGIQISSGEEAYLYGEEGYMIKLENRLAEGKERETAGLIAQDIVGLRFRPFSGECFSFLDAEFMDLAYFLDRQGRSYRTFLTDINFVFNSFTALACTADDPIRNSSDYASEAAEAVVKARKNTQKQISEYDKAVQMMTSIMANSMGMFTTIEKTENGGEIIYQHNKQTLDESDIIWKKSEQGFVVSTDGGKTWNAGMDASGNAVVNILSAIGLNAEWVNAGRFIVRDNKGNITFLADVDTGQVLINAESISIGGKSIRNIADSSAATKIDAQTQSDIFNKLTNNGNAAGMFLVNGQLYFSFSYAQGGTLKLGGANNVNGTMEILNSDGIQIGKWDKDGINITEGAIETSDGLRKTRVGSGRVTFFKDGVQTGTVRPIAWGGDYDNNEGVIFATNASYAAVAYNAGNGYGAGYILNNGLNPNDYTERNLFYKNTRFVDDVFAKNVYLSGSTFFSNDCYLGAVVYNSSPALRVTNGGFYAQGDLGCSGTKYRVVNTEHYGNIGMNAVESASPYFTDIGSGIVGQDGKIIIFFDPVFAETIDLKAEYQVFLTRTSEQKIDHVEKEDGYFTVHGDPGATFDWMLCAKQKDYSASRLERVNIDVDTEFRFDESIFNRDHEAITKLEQLNEEYEKEIVLL